MQFRSKLLLLSWLTVLTIFFTGRATINLANFRPVSADESAILDVSYNLTTERVLGSDIYAEFYGAGTHFFINLPAYHIVQALGFNLIGTGMFQARLISVFFAIGLIWLVGGLTWRWYGLSAAILATSLMLFWRSDLIGVAPGLPHLAVGRSGRYDIATLFWIWLTIALLDQLRHRSGRGWALAVGLAAGLATLTQFYGVFIIPIIALVWTRKQTWKSLTRPETWIMVAGFALIVLPYILWVLANTSDFLAQLAKYGERGSFFDIHFWIENVLFEWRRYQGMGQQAFQPVSLRSLSFGSLFFFVVVGPALIAMWRRDSLPEGGSGRLLWIYLLIFSAQLLFMEQTKAPLYAIILWPVLCIAVSVLFIDSWKAFHSWSQTGGNRNILSLVAYGIGLFCLVILLMEGSAAYVLDHRQALSVSDYLEVGEEIASKLPPGAVIAGENQWWWALHEFNYRGIKVPFFRAQIDYRKSGAFSSLNDQLQADGIDYILLNNSFVGELFDTPPGFRQQYWQLLARCSTKIMELNDFTYGPIELYVLNQECGG